MEWDNNNIEAMVTYINSELEKGRTMIDIEENDFSVNERVIHKRLNRKGYHRVGNKYINAPLVASQKISSDILKKHIQTATPIQKHIKKDNKKSNTNLFSHDEVIAIKELILNKDKLLNLLELKEIDNTKCNIRSKKNETRSFRVDSGLYKAFKKKANKNRDKITDLLNEFMEEYIRR